MELNMKYKLTVASLLFCCVAVVTAQEASKTPEPTQNLRSLPPVSPLPLDLPTFYGDEGVSPPSAVPARTAPTVASGLSSIASDLPRNRQPENSTQKPPALFYRQSPAGTDGVNLQDFSCIEYRGRPLSILLRGDDWSLPQVTDISGDDITPVAQSAIPQWVSEINRTHEGDLGWFPSETTSAAPEFPDNSVLLLCKDGVKITTARTLLKSGTTTKLKRFAKVKGTVKFAGAASLHGEPMGAGKAGFVVGQDHFFVTAQWESIPFHPELISQPAEKLKNGPGLFRVFMTAPLSLQQQSGPVFKRTLSDPFEDSPSPQTTKQSEVSFETRVPPGRIQFSIIKGDPKNTSAWEPTGISWWETVRPGDAEDTVHELTPPTFELSIVRGQIKQTNRLLESLTTVKQVDGRVEVGRAQLQVMFESGKNSTSFSEDRSLEDLLRKAAIWGRPDGSRETSGYQLAINSIDAMGAFTCVIPTSFLKSAVVSILKDRSGLAYDVAQVPAEDLRAFSDDDSIFRQASNERQLDFREIDLDPYLGGATHTVPESSRFDRSGNGMPPLDPLEQPAGGDTDLLLAEPASPLPPGRSDSNPMRHEPLAQVLPFKQQSASPIDRTIADLVAKLLSSGDRRTRQTMKEPLKKLLQQRFDAEQKAREQLLNELRKRFDKANEQITERAARRDAIISEQLQRMLSLPEDDFEVLPEPDDRGDRLNDTGGKTDLRRNPTRSSDILGDDLEVPPSNRSLTKQAS